MSYASNPNAPIRWVNQWDNLQGTIECGYGYVLETSIESNANKIRGPSIFFNNGVVVDDLTRVSEYARLLASIRINGIVVNNVSANVSSLTPQNIAGLGRIADAMRPYGVQ